MTCFSSPRMTVDMVTEATLDWYSRKDTPIRPFFTVNVGLGLECQSAKKWYDL